MASSAQSGTISTPNSHGIISAYRPTVTKSSGAISKKLPFPRRALRILKVRQIAGDSPHQMQEHSSGMLVCGNRLTKRHIAKILQRIRKSVIRRVTRFPQPVPLRKFLWRERRESQQIVRPILDHVDAQIVSRVNAKMRPVRVAEGEPLHLDQPVERRMFHSLDFR